MRHVTWQGGTCGVTHISIGATCGHNSGFSIYSLATEEQTHEAFRWALAARVIQLEANDMDVNATLRPEMFKQAMEALMQQWSRTDANKHRHGETSPMTQSRRALKSRFRVWARAVYGNFIILQSLLITGKYSSTHVGLVAKVQANQTIQYTYGRIMAPHTEARKHQRNRKWMRWLENQMQARGLLKPTTRMATDSAPPCSHCFAVSSSECIICHRPLCGQCRRGKQCINTGNCRNYIDPPTSKGKGKGRAKGMSNQQLVETYHKMVAKVNAYVDSTGRGRRADGTWGSSAYATMGAMWLTSHEFAATGQCGICSWRSDDLWRCTFCHIELCDWHIRWKGSAGHCPGGCEQRAHVG